jgi:membrane-associated phospholipid phosphatase
MRRRRRSFSGAPEVALGLGAYAAYLAVRHVALARAGRERARRNAVRLLAIERKLGIDVEGAVQGAVVGAPRLVYALNGCYAGLNVALSVGWLLRLFRRRDPGFQRERSAAVLAFAGALPVFLALPVAPPRTQVGYVDTLGEAGVDIEHPFLVRFYNPIAALPSQHVAFAVVTGGGLAARSRGLGRAVAWAYAPVVSLVVVATANHYVLDVAAGAALGALARALTR